MFLNRAICLFYMVLLGGGICAQPIAAPSFSCVTNLFNGDVLLNWQPTANMCNTVGYEIYATSSLSGGFTLLATTTSNVYGYTHTNANGNNIVWHYYLKTLTSCPSFPAEHSDTLDNIDPLTPIIERATVENNQAIFHWKYGASPETYAYIIYKKRQPPSNGFVIVDTVYGRFNTTFADPASAPASRIEAYTIVAMDSCGNTGLISDEPHNTIWLRYQTDRCTPSVVLTWNPYNNWQQGVKHYQIYQSTNGNPPEVIANTSDTTYTIYNIKDNDYVCWTVTAMEELGTNTATSNDVCTTINIVEPIRTLLLTQTSFSPDNTQIIAYWLWNSDADLATTAVSSNTLPTTPLSTTLPLQPANQAPIAISQIPAANTAIWITATDSCNTSTASNQSFPPILSATINNEPSITFYWTPYTNTYPNAQITSYNLYRIENNIPIHIVALPSTATSYTHLLNINNSNEANAAYYLTAHTTLPLFSTPTPSRSNTLNVSITPILRIPNAIAPTGANNCFKPLFIFPQNIHTYSLQIYNRWGGLIFNTNNPSQCWDGTLTSNNAPAPIGTYAYHIQLSDVAAPDKPIHYQGTITVIR